MSQSEIIIGHTYAIRHYDGFLKPITVLSLDRQDKSAWRTHAVLHYRCRNELTGHIVTVKSAAKFRYETERGPDGIWKRKERP